MNATDDSLSDRGYSDLELITGTFGNVLAEELDKDIEEQTEHDKRLPEAFTFKIFRWPVLAGILLIIVVELFLYIFIRQIVMLFEKAFVFNGKKLVLKNKLKTAKTYEEYKMAALEIDDYLGYSNWKKVTNSAYYDYRLIRRITRLLSGYRGTFSGSSSNHSEILADTALIPNITSDGSSPSPRMSISTLDGLDSNTILGPPPSFQLPDHTILNMLLRVLLDAALKPNIGGVENPTLYSKTYYGTKIIVDEFVQEVSKTLDFVRALPTASLSNAQKYKLFKRATKQFGTTALCLSGGATFGYYHLGVIKTLLQQNILPHVITGTSAGALIASFVCSRTDEELMMELHDPALYSRFNACSDMSFKRFFQTKAMFDPTIWEKKLDWVTRGDTTFLEAYEKTKRVLNITVISETEHSPPKLLNYKTAPNVTIKSAILASSAVPGILPPIELKQKNEKGEIVWYHEEGRFWRDGSLRVDIPISGLHQMFQVNPHVVLFFFDAKGGTGTPTSHRKGKGWRGGFILSLMEQYLKLDMKKWLLVLRDLQLLPMIHSQDWSHIWLQKFAGNVTVVPHVNWSDYWNILNDPDETRMNRYIMEGERMTWPKVKMIENRMKIERKIINYREGYKLFKNDSN